MTAPVIILVLVVHLPRREPNLKCSEGLEVHCPVIVIAYF